MTTKDKLLELINVIIESYEGEYDNATEAKWNLYWGEKVQQLKQIKSIIEFHFSMTESWFPTAKSINALPEPIRKYIHDIETNCDPAGIVQENTILKDTIKALQKKPIISEEERKMAIWYFKHHIGYGATESDRFYKIILKALGEPK